jgi:hypothetical protein
MRYLLDELIAYEDGFGDILMVDRATERHETFMGTQSSVSLDIQKGLHHFETRLLDQVRNLLEDKSGHSNSEFLACSNHEFAYPYHQQQQLHSQLHLLVLLCCKNQLLLPLQHDPDKHPRLMMKFFGLGHSEFLPQDLLMMLSDIGRRETKRRGFSSHSGLGHLPTSHLRIARMRRS